MLELLSSSSVLRPVPFTEVVVTFKFDPEVTSSLVTSSLLTSSQASFRSDESSFDAKPEKEVVVVTMDREVTYIRSLIESLTSVSSDADTKEELVDSSLF